MPATSPDRVGKGTGKGARLGVKRAPNKARTPVTNPIPLDQLPRCPQPGCGRIMRPNRTRISDYPGTVQQSTQRGICMTCVDHAKQEALEADRNKTVADMIDWLDWYTRQRRARGIHPSGYHRNQQHARPKGEKPDGEYDVTDGRRHHRISGTPAGGTN